MNIIANKLNNFRKKLLDLTSRNRMINLSSKTQDNLTIATLHAQKFLNLIFSQKYISVTYPMEIQKKVIIENPDWDCLENSNKNKIKSNVTVEQTKEVEVAFYALNSKISIIKDATKESAYSALSQYSKLNELETNLVPKTVFEGNKHVFSAICKNKEVEIIGNPVSIHKKLNKIRVTSNSHREEMGSETMFLTIGFLRWKESPSNKITLRSPLIIIPISLKDIRSTNSFDFKYTGDEIVPNLALAKKLKESFNIDLPRYNDGLLDEYFNDLDILFADNIRGYEIEKSASFSILNYLKQSMYEDLTPEKWSKASKITNHGIIGSFFDSETDFDNPKPTNSHKDPLIIEDADNTQISAINSALNNESFILEGPPGTGKSQTITNMIAALIAEGKKILFVTEKSVAIEVVHKKLVKAGLGDLCLNMHSSTATKSNVLSSLAKSISMPSIIDVDIAKKNKRKLDASMDELNEYADNINSYHRQTGLTIHQILMITKILKDKMGLEKKELLDPILDYNEITHDYLVQIQVFKKNYHDAVSQIIEQYGVDMFFEHQGWRAIDFSPIFLPDINDIELKIDQINVIFKEIISEVKQSELRHYANEINEKDIAAILALINKINPITSKKCLSSLRLMKESNSSFDNKAIKAKLENNIVKLNNIPEKLNKYFIESIKGKRNLEEIFDLNKKVSTYGFDGYTDYVCFSKKINAVHNNKEVLRRIFSNFTKNISKECSGILPYSIEGILNLLKVIFFYKKLDINTIAYKSISFSKLEADYIKDFHHRKEECLKLRGIVSQKYNIKKINALSIESIDEIIHYFTEEGFFSFLSSGYRRSSALLQSISRSKDNIEYSRDDLLSIKSYKIKQNECISTSEKDKSVLSHLYSGLKTKTKEIISIISWQNEIKSTIGWNLSGNKKLSEFIINNDLEFIEEITNSEKLMNLISNIKSVNAYFSKFPKSNFNKYLLENKVPNEILQIKEMTKGLNADQIALYSMFDCEYFLELSDLYLDFDECNHIKEQLDYSAFDDIDIFSLESVTEVFNMISEAKSLAGELRVSHSTFNDKILRCIEEEGLENIGKIINKLSIKANKVREIHYEITSKYKINLSDWYGKKEDASFAEKLQLNERQLSISNASKLFKKLSLQQEKAKDLGIAHLIKKIESDGSLLNSDMNYIDYCVYAYLVDDVWLSNKYLDNFSSIEHNNAISNFREIDVKQKELNINIVKQAVLSHEIPKGNNKGKIGNFTEKSLIEHHANLQRPNISIRNIFKNAQKAVMALKPCVMMSPLSVGKFLPKEAGMFDVLIIDEASQVRPEDSLGSIARAKQIIIVGDKKQLPPTNFFSANGDRDENESTKIESAESILVGVSNILPSKMLKWHYRSRNESLINFSNQRIYDGALISFPSPDAKASGIKYHFVQGGFFEAGVNKNECYAIKERLEKILQESPGQTVGIAAMNMRQSVFLDELINNDKDLYKEIQRHEKRTGDSIFIKNLENVQGDERDIIIISGTYGKNPTTKRVRQGFGPLTRNGGWRRLNVLITRAKRRIEFFSSMDFKEVKISDKSNESLVKYREYLEYAKTGIIKSQHKSMGAPDSDFEISVIEKLETLGYKCVSQVGEAGYKIDIGVLNKEEDSFLLGIECDGASYHSSKSARDRDRLRQQVLEGMGWSIARIWSTDWFMDDERCIDDIKRQLKSIEDYSEASEKVSVNHYSNKATIRTNEPIIKENESYIHLIDAEESPVIDCNYTPTKEDVYDLKFIINETLIEQVGKLDGIRSKYKEANLSFDTIAKWAGYKGIYELESILINEFRDNNRITLRKDNR